MNVQRENWRPERVRCRVSAAASIRHTSRSPSPRSGFTLIEVTAACVLLMILASIAVAGLRGRIHIAKLTQALEQIESADRAARGMARIHGGGVRLDFDASQNQVHVMSGRRKQKTVRLPTGVRLEGVRVGRRSSRGRQQVAVSASGQSATYAVTFRTDTSTRFLVVAGLSGQTIRTNSQEQVDALLRL